MKTTSAKSASNAERMELQEARALTCRYGGCRAYALAQIKVGGGLAVRLCGLHLVTVLTDATFDGMGWRLAKPPKVRLVLLGTEAETEKPKKEENK